MGRRSVTQSYSLGPEYDSQLVQYPLLRRVLALHPAGCALEFGVGRGDSLRIIAAEMPVVGFDSFQGLPEFWRPEFPKGALAQPHPPIVNNSRLVVGWFADTLPAFDFGALGQIGLVHIDCDLYSSTATVLAHAGKWLGRNCFVVFDEWHGYKGCRHHEQRAWREYVGPKTSWMVVGHARESWAIKLLCHNGTRDL